MKDMSRDCVAPQWYRRFADSYAVFSRDRFAWICALAGMGFIAVAAFAPVIAPYDPSDLATVELANSMLPPFSPSEFGDGFHYLGTDILGRDILSMALFGLRISLAVATLSAVGALLLGCLAGLVAAFAPSWMNAVIMRVVDLFLGFPAILTALLFISVLGRGAENTVLAILAVQWTHYARAVNAAAKTELGKDYVQAAKLLGVSKMRIAIEHVLPNCLAPVWVIFAVQFGYVIAIEASLSFLGLGLPITQPSLGSLVADGQQYMLSGIYWISLLPGFILLLLVFSINVVGDRLRVMQNPELV